MTLTGRWPILRPAKDGTENPERMSFLGLHSFVYLFFAAAVMIFLGVRVLGRRRAPDGLAFALLVFTASEWALARALESIVRPEALKIVFVKLSYPGMTGVAPLWLIFILAATGRAARLNRLRLALLWAVPLAFMVLAWTNELHGLAWKAILPPSSGFGVRLVFVQGPAVWIHTSYAYILFLAGAALLFFKPASGAPPYSKKRRLLLILAVSSPWVGNIVYLSRISAPAGFDSTPFLLALSSIILFMTVFRTHLLDILPVAYDVLVKSMREGVLVLDAADRLIDMNPAARRLLGIDLRALGSPAGAVLPGWAEIDRQRLPRRPLRTEVGMGPAREPRYLEFGLSPFSAREPAGSGTILLVRDVTDRKKADLAVRAALNEKELLLRELHHRVKNNMQVIMSLLNLQKKDLRRRPLEGVLKDTQDRILSMALVHEKLLASKDMARVDFRDYVRSLMARLMHAHKAGADRIKFKLESDPIELDINTAIPAGLLILELASNALKHAFPKGRSGSIRIRMAARPGGTTDITIKDDGVGLPPGLDIRKADSLGLQIVRMLVQQLDGTINLRRGRGTEFRVAFRALKYAPRT